MPSSRRSVKRCSPCSMLQRRSFSEWTMSSGRLDVAGVGRRRHPQPRVDVLPHRPAELALEDPEQVARAEGAHEVVDRPLRERGLEAIRVADDPGGHVAAVRAAEDAEPVARRGTGTSRAPSPRRPSGPRSRPSPSPCPRRRPGRGSRVPTPRSGRSRRAGSRRGRSSRRRRTPAPRRRSPSRTARTGRRGSRAASGSACPRRSRAGARATRRPRSRPRTSP